MLSAVFAWLAKEGLGVILGALGKLALDALNSYQANKALREVGAASTAAKVNAETLETKNAMDDVARPSDDDVARSLQRTEF